MNDRFTEVSDALDQAMNVLKRIVNSESVSIGNEYERRLINNLLSDMRYYAELANSILLDARESMGGKASTVRVSTSVDHRDACQIPPEVMEKEIKCQHADALAREVAMHAITAIRQDPVFDMMVFETTVTFIAPEKEKNR